MSIQTDEGPYDYVKAIVRENGIELRYRCTGLTVSGKDFIDDDTANTWTDREIQKTAGQYLGVTSGENEIEVIFD